MRLPEAGRVPVALGALLFAGIAAARFALPDAGDTILVFLIAPIAVLGVALGLAGGLGAALAACAVQAAYGLASQPDLGVLGYASRALAFLITGGLVGYLTGRMTALARAREQAEAELRSRDRVESELRSQRATVEQLADERGRLVSQVLEAEEEARREVAQALHDETLQNLLAAHQELIDAAPGREGVVRARDVVAGTIQGVREAMASLHPVTLREGGLGQALGAVAKQACERRGLRSSVRVEADAAGVYADLVFSIGRELLVNAGKHSGAERVSLVLERAEGGVVLEVSDDGSGMPEDRPEKAFAEGHVGLASVRQRVEGVGGHCEIGSRPGAGTTVRIWLPSE